MAKVLVTWKDNWADEMDVEGFKIYDEADWKSYEAEMKAVEKKFDICIGSNEEIEFDCGQDLLNTLTVKKISDDEAKTVTKLFGTDFGFTQFADVYIEEDEEEEVDEQHWLDHEDDDEDY